MSYHRVDLEVVTHAQALEHDPSIAEREDDSFVKITTYWSEHDEKFDRGHVGIAWCKVDGVLRWCSNDSVVPGDIMEKAPWPAECIVLMDKVRETETLRFLTEYRERMKDYEPSAEELFEMRAAFGPGETVVNVITGRRTKL